MLTYASFYCHRVIFLFNLNRKRTIGRQFSLESLGLCYCQKKGLLIQNVTIQKAHYKISKYEYVSFLTSGF